MARKPTQRQIYDRLVRTHNRQVADAFLAAVQAARDGVNLRELAAAIDLRDYDRMARILRLDSARLYPLTEAVRSTYIAGGLSVTQAIPASIGAVFAFDGRNPRAEAWIAERSGTLVQSIDDDTLPMLRSVVGDGIARGRSGATVARDITGRLNRATGQRVGGFLGLTSEQTDYVINARNMLSDPEQIGRYFIKDRKTGKLKPRYKLSDRKFDSIVRKAIADGKALSPVDLERVIDAHKAKSLAYRGRFIARNESRAATSAGQREAYEQLLEDPDVEDVTKRWQYNYGDQQENREDHISLGHAPARSFNEPFIMGDGAQMQYAHDPAGGAENILHCHCSTIYRVVLRAD